MNQKFSIFLFIMIIGISQLSTAQINTARSGIALVITSSQSLEVFAVDGDNNVISDKIDNKDNVRLGSVNQINVFSNSKFVLKVSARNDFNESDGAEIPPTSVYVSSGAASNAKYQSSDYIFEKDVNLAINNPKALIHAQTSGSLNNSFDIEYYASGLGFEDLHHSNLDGTVVYTIEAE